MLDPNMSQSKVPLDYLFMWRVDVLVIFFGDPESACQYIDLLLYMVRDNISMIWKYFLESYLMYTLSTGFSFFQNGLCSFKSSST